MLETTRLIPVHTLVAKLPALCKVLRAVHTLSGCDIVSKLGTKSAALKADPVKYLVGFGQNPHYPDNGNIFAKAEEYLVHVLKVGTECKTIDQLCYWLYHHSKGMTIDKLPPTSYAAHFIQHM